MKNRRDRRICGDVPNTTTTAVITTSCSGMTNSKCDRNHISLSLSGEPINDEKRNFTTLETTHAHTAFLFRLIHKKKLWKIRNSSRSLIIIIIKRRGGQRKRANIRRDLYIFIRLRFFSLSSIVTVAVVQRFHTSQWANSFREIRRWCRSSHCSITFAIAFRT